MRLDFNPTPYRFSNDGLRVLVAALLSFVLAHQAYADDTKSFYDLEMQVYTDRSGTVSISDILAEPEKFDFKAIPWEGFSGGYGDEIHWFKFEISPLQAAFSDYQIIMISPAHLDDVKVYLPIDGKGYSTHVGGDLIPYNERVIPFTGIAIPIPNPKVAVTAYMRLETEGSAIMFARSMTPYQFSTKSLWSYVYLGLITGVVGLSILIKLIGFQERTDRLFWIYIGYMFSYFFLILSAQGYLSFMLFFDDTSLVGITNNLAMALAAIFTYAYYRELLYTPERKNIARPFDALGFMLVVLGVLGLTYFDFQWFNPVWVFIFACFVTVSYICVDLFRFARGGSSRRILYVLAILVSLCGLLFTLLSLVGLLPLFKLYLYAYQISALLGIVAFEILLYERLAEVHADTINARRIVTEMEERAREKEEADELQLRFLSMVYHELRTPLSVIRLALGMEDPSEQTLEYARQATNNIDSIVERCAYSERLEDRKFKSTIEDVDVIPMITDITRKYENFEVKHDDETFVVRGDREFLRVVFSNLIENAMKYSVDGSPVSIDLLKISDTIGEENHIYFRNEVELDWLIDTKKIFERYIRSPGSEGVSGSGVGLYIVKGLLESMHAEISCSIKDHVIEFEIKM